MGALETALQEARKSVPDCIATGYVDMTTATLVALHTIEPLPEPIVNLLAATTADMFQGRNVAAMEQLFRRARKQSEDGAHYFQDIVITSQKRLHVMLRAKRNPNHVAVFVCRSSASLGMVLATARMSLVNLEDAIAAG